MTVRLEVSVDGHARVFTLTDFESVLAKATKTLEARGVAPDSAVGKAFLKRRLLKAAKRKGVSNG